MKLRKCPNATFLQRSAREYIKENLLLPLIDILMRKMLQGILMCPRVNSNIAFCLLSLLQHLRNLRMKSQLACG